MTRVRLLIMVLVLTACSAVYAQPQIIFEDDFEAGVGNWTLWDDASWVPRQDCPGPVNCWGPLAVYLRSDYEHSHYYPQTGNTGVRHVIGQPQWSGRWHAEETLIADLGSIIEASIWQFEDYNKQAPFPPGYWEAGPHDQVQSWLVLMSEDETEYFALGVHAHVYSPAPVGDWWGNLSWGTAADGWQTTTYPRSQGWRRLRIVVHPYTGQAGDVEFYVAPDPGAGNEPEYVLVGSGRRLPGGDCRGIPISRMGMGANPALIAEDYIANTYEHFWYDDAALSVEEAGLPCANPELRFDADADGDVDQTDFGVFQSCISGDGVTYDCPRCKCMNSDEDTDIDGDDLAAFKLCASGPMVPADITCDDLLAAP